jgi:hypothetical protein
MKCQAKIVIKPPIYKDSIQQKAHPIKEPSAHSTEHKKNHAVTIKRIHDKAVDRINDAATLALKLTEKSNSLPSMEQTRRSLPLSNRGLTIEALRKRKNLICTAGVSFVALLLIWVGWYLLSGGIGFSIGEKTQWKNAGFTVNEAKNWKRLGFTSDVAPEWKRSGFIAAEEALEWKTSGFTPKDAAKWKQAAFSVTAAKEFLEIGFERSRPEMALCFKDLGYSVQDIGQLKKNNFTCDEASKWKNAGLNTNAMIFFTGIGFDRRSDFENAKRWVNSGFSFNDIEQLLNSGFDKRQPDNAKKLLDIGYTPTQVIELQKSGVDYFKLEEWMAGGFSKEEIPVFHQAGFSINLAKQWKATGLSLPDIKFLLKDGVSYIEARRVAEFKKLDLPISDCVVLSDAKYDAEEVKRLSDSGMNVAAIVDWAKAGIEQKEAIGWMRGSITLAEAEKWRQAGFTVSEVGRLKLAAFKIEDVLKWNSSGLPREQIKDWISAAVKFEEFEDWKSLGVSANEVGKYKAGGFSPSEAAAWKQKGYSCDTATRFKKDGLDLEKVSRLSPDEQIIYKFEFAGLTLGMSEIEAVKILEEFARTNHLFRRYGIVYDARNIAHIVVNADKGRVNSVAFHGGLVKLPYNEFGLDKQASRKYLENTYGVKLDDFYAYQGNKLRISIDKFKISFRLN